MLTDSDYESVPSRIWWRRRFERASSSFSPNRLPLLWRRTYTGILQAAFGWLPIAGLSLFILYVSFRSPFPSSMPVAAKYAQLGSVALLVCYIFLIGFVLPWFSWLIAKAMARPQSDEEFLQAIGAAADAAGSRMLAIRRALGNIYCVRPDLIRVTDTGWRLSRYSLLSDPPLMECLSEILCCLERRPLKSEAVALTSVDTDGRDWGTVGDLVRQLDALVGAD